MYENAVELASILVQKNPNYFHKQLKALHLIGTRYSILGNFEKGNIYFENAIQILPKNQFKNYKTIILNYATNLINQYNSYNYLRMKLLLMLN